MGRKGSVCVALLALLSAVLTSSAFAQEVLIENVTVLAPEGRPPIRNANVLIREGRVAEVGMNRVNAGPGAVRLDGRGKYLTPGLMDSHVHLSHTPGLPHPAFDKSKRAQDLRDDYFRQQPRDYLYFGVTQVVDLVNTAQGLATFRSQPLHPDLFHCGQAPVIDGYGVETYLDKSIRYQDNPNYLFEPANAGHPMPEGADPKEHTPEAVVQRIAASGAMCVKVFIENGFGDRTDLPLISNATLQRIRTLAHERNLLLVAHANAIDMLRIAVANDVDVIAHGTWNWLDADGKPGVPEEIASQLREVHRKNIGFQPTLQVIAGLGAQFDPATLEDPLYTKVVPPTVLAWYRTDEGKASKNMERSFWPKGMSEAEILKRYRAIGEQGARALKYLYDLGHPLLLGSDTPAAPTYGNQPGYNTYREIQMMARAGIPPWAVFDAGTINNARRFRLEKDYGSIERGKIANLLLLQANPLENTEAWGRIDKVILRGKVIERESLAAR